MQIVTEDFVKGELENEQLEKVKKLLIERLASADKFIAYVGSDTEGHVIKFGYNSLETVGMLDMIKTIEINRGIPS